MVSGTSTLSLSKSRLERNKAGKYRVGTGGGVTVNAEASIRLKDTVVAGNHATRHGGGIRVLSDHFNSVEVADAADGRGNTALYDGAHDISYAPRQLEIVSHNAEGGFVPELRASLQVNVSVIGPQQRPTAGEDVEATLLEADGKVVQVSSKHRAFLGVLDWFLIYKLTGHVHCIRTAQLFSALLPCQALLHRATASERRGL